MTTKQELLECLLPLAFTASEEEYIKRMFEQKELSSADIEFLETLQKRRVEELDQSDAELHEASQMLEFAMNESLQNMLEQEENFPIIKDELYREAFDERNQHIQSKDSAEIDSIKSLLKK